MKAHITFLAEPVHVAWYGVALFVGTDPETCMDVFGMTVKQLSTPSEVRGNQLRRNAFLLSPLFYYSMSQLFLM